MDSFVDNIKKILKRLLKVLLRSKIFIIIMLLLLIVFVLLPSFVYYITVDDGTYKEGDWENTPYVASTYTSSVNISSAGITTETTAQENWDKLIEEDSNVKEYLTEAEELEKLMNAEIISQYPKIGNPNAKIDGIVEFKRHKTDGTSFMLTYVELPTFNSYINNNDTRVQYYYTLDEEKNLLIGMIDETTETLTYNDDQASVGEYSDSLSESNLSSEGKYTKTVYNVYAKKINYIELIEKYTMPFQYLWSLVVVGDDKGVALELADLVKDSQIIISIYDNITTTEKRSTFTYNREKKVDVMATATCYTNYGNFSASNSWKPAAEWQEGSYQIDRVITYKNNTPIIDVSKADVWIVDYSRDYGYQSSSVISTETNEKDLEETPYVSDNTSFSETNGSDLQYYDKFANLLAGLVNDLTYSVANSVEESVVNNIVMELVIDSAEITSCVADYHMHNVNRHQKDVTTTSSQSYIAKTAINNPKIQKKTKEEIKNGTGQDNFVTILCDPAHSGAKYKMTEEIPDWLLDLLESNPDTKNMVDLTKYLLNAVTDESSSGTIDYDFSVFETSGFSDTNVTIKGGTIQEKVWNTLKDLGYSDISAAGAMGNIHYESGSFNPSAVEHGYTEDTGGIGLCQWTNSGRGKTGRNTDLKNYAISKGLTWQDEDIQVQFLRGELTSGGGADGYASYQLSNTQSFYGSTLACASAWKTSTTVEDAAKAFCYSFERPAKEAAEKSMATRISYANQYYAMYSGK